VGELVLADPDQLVDRAAGQAEAPFGFFRTPTLAMVRRFRSIRRPSLALTSH
jgi:hypothetical protein